MSDASALPKSAPAIGKLHSRHLRWAMPLVLSFAATCVVSLISTVLAVGFTPALAVNWLSNWAFAWAIAFPTLVAVLPHARRLVALFIRLN